MRNWGDSDGTVTVTVTKPRRSGEQKREKRSKEGKREKRSKGGKGEIRGR